MSTYLDLTDAAAGGGHQITLWWADTQPDRVHLIFMDPRIVDSKGEKPGLRIVFSSNPKSADYSPGNFNRCIRLLRSQGKPAPAEDVVEHPRHLRYRDKVIEKVLGDDEAVAQLSLPDKKTPVVVPEDAVLCPTCSAFVADLDQHDKALHN